MEPINPNLDYISVPLGSRQLVYGEGQPEYSPLPAVRTPDNQVITRWRLTEEERQRIAEGKDIFLTFLSTGPINPVILTIGPIDWTTTFDNG